MHLVIFEDSRWDDFAPFSLSRPVFCLASGMTTLLDKQIRHLKPTRLTLWVRPEMESYCRERVAPETGVPTQVNVPLDTEPTLLINGRNAFSNPTEIPSSQAIAMSKSGMIVSALVQQPLLGPSDALTQTERWSAMSSLATMPPMGRLIDSPIDLLYWNEHSIVEDFSCLKDFRGTKPVGHYHLVNEMDIRLGQDVTLSPGCVLDASKGPIILSEGVSVGANAVVQGPCWIGPGSVVAPLANIRSGTSIGAFCKVGGEVSVSIFLGYSNKSHEGFLGHSYIGKWVNLGAGTTTSNLKNTYGPISLKRGNREIHTGHRFVGSLIGDHSKTAICTRLMGGSYIGYFSMLAGSAISPRFIPSRTFWTDKGAEPYHRDKAVEVAQRVFSRRDRIWTDTDEQIMNYVTDIAPQIEV